MINEHLKITDANNHNIIETVNQQIHINEQFNKSINALKDMIITDREMIQNAMHRQADQIFKKIALINIRLSLHGLNRIVTQLQNDIVLAKIGMISPSLLTHTEIIKFNIDANKMKHLSLGMARTTNKQLIFLMKIPFDSITANVKLIVSLSSIDTCKKLSKNNTTNNRIQNHTV